MAKKNSGPPKIGVSANTNDSAGILGERLGWTQKIGWGIATVYAVIFAGFITWYLPKELESSRNVTKNDIEQAVAPVRVDVAKLTERLSKQIAFNLQSLIPPVELARTIDPTVLKARFQEADSLINTAIAQRIPATPAILRDAQLKLRTTAHDPKIANDVRAVANATLVSFEAYQIYSSTIVVVNAPKIVVDKAGPVYAPVSIDKTVWLEGTGKDGAKLTIDFTGTHPPYPYPAAFAITGGDALISKMRVEGKDRSPNFVIVSSPQSQVLVSETKVETSRKS